MIITFKSPLSPAITIDSKGYITSVTGQSLGVPPKVGYRIINHATLAVNGKCEMNNGHDTWVYQHVILKLDKPQTT